MLSEYQLNHYQASLAHSNTSLDRKARIREILYLDDASCRCRACKFQKEIMDNEHLCLLIKKAGGKRPAKGTSVAGLRQLLRDAYEVKLEAEQPLAGFAVREREAVKAAFA